VEAVKVEDRTGFCSLLVASGRAPEIPASADVYGWLCGDWDLDVLRYGGVDVAGGLTGEVHAARVLEGRAVQDVWIMPQRADRHGSVDRTMNMYGTTLRSWDDAIQAWRIAWTNPVSGHREEQVGRWDGNGIRQEGMRANGTRTRWTFTEITAESFHWRGEALYPDQQLWTLEAEFLAKRRR
jgi:hypothetical protein